MELLVCPRLLFCHSELLSPCALVDVLDLFNVLSTHVVLSIDLLTTYLCIYSVFLRRSVLCLKECRSLVGVVYCVAFVTFSFLVNESSLDAPQLLNH